MTLRLPLALAAAALLAASCGREQEQAQPPTETPPATPYGNVETATAYRQQIEPVIQAVVTAQSSVDLQVGRTGRAAAPNLAAAMAAELPRLRDAQSVLDTIEPPPGLALMHTDIRKLLELRAGAYQMAADHQQAAADTAWYRTVESKLEDANELIVSLNQQLARVDETVRAAQAAASQVASP